LILKLSATSALAQDSESVLYVPLIGITSVPAPLALPDGAGDVTYNYAVKNFLQEIPLTDIRVIDDTCSPVKFANGDDNNDAKLDYSETWRYTCRAKLSKTTQSIATAIGHAHNITATHKAYATVVVGRKDPAPIVSIINVSKIAYPLSLPVEGGNIIFTYKVNNPGIVPLSDISVIDNKCKTMSGKLGDINGNSLLDTNEVWVYTCTAYLTHTTTNSVTVTGFANGLKAVDDTSVTVKVDTPSGSPAEIAQSAPKFPNVGEGLDSAQKLPNVGETSDVKIVVWIILAVVLTGLIIFFVVSKKHNLIKMLSKFRLIERGAKR
jgi:hypothetical protein